MQGTVIIALKRLMSSPPLPHVFTGIGLFNHYAAVLPPYHALCRKHLLREYALTIFFFCP